MCIVESGLAASRRLFAKVEDMRLDFDIIKNEIKSKGRLLLPLVCTLLEGWRVGRKSQEWSSGKENGLLKMLNLWFFSLPRNFKECPAVSGYV